MEQLDILTHARATDPQTSKDAAASVELGKQCERVLRCLEFGKTQGRDGLTAAEIVDWMTPAPQQSVVARRLTDLREKGLARQTDRTRKGPSGRMLTVWEAV